MQMKIINILLYILNNLLALMLSTVYTIFVYVYLNESILSTLLFFLLSVLLLISFIIGYKKINIKYNVLNFILLLFILLNIFRPYIDSLISPNLVYNVKLNFLFSYVIFEQNFIIITIFMIILLIVNSIYYFIKK